MQKPHVRVLSTVLVFLMGADALSRSPAASIGKVIEGTFLAGDSKTVRMLLANGSKAEVAIEEVLPWSSRRVGRHRRHRRIPRAHPRR